MLRMLLGPDSSPRVLLPMVVLKLRKVTWLSALVASKRRSMLLRSVTRKVRPDGFVKVLDFGLAKLRETTSSAAGASDLRTRPGNLAGTIQYLSPEQIQGEPAGPRSDLFSLGVVAYELATRVRPFDGPTD